MWTWPLQQGCVNKCEIFKHYLLPITLNVHVPRSRFLKIKNRVRSRHPQRPNICTPKFFHILVTKRRKHSAHPSAPKAAAAASRAGPCPASRDTIQVHLHRLLPETRHPKVPGTQRASAQQHWSKNHLLSHFYHLGMQHYLHGSLPRALQGRGKMKRAAFKEALFLYIIKANLYFKCCFWYLYCFFNSQKLFQLCPGICGFEKSGSGILDAQF